MIKVLVFAPILYLIAGCAQSNVGHTDEEVIENISTHPQYSKRPPKLIERPSYGDPDFKPRRNVSPKTTRLPTGSLFDPEQYEGMFVHKRHYSIGDMIRVVIEEEMDATKNLRLKKDKSSDVEIDPLELSGGPFRVTKGDIILDHSQSSNFESSAISKQSNSLRGMLNVFVKEVLSNGNLVVTGEKWIKLNEGYEYVRLTGEIRRKDINSDNQISSSFVGNAQIEFSSTGEFADNQAPSVLDRIISIFN